MNKQRLFLALAFIIVVVCGCQSSPNRHTLQFDGSGGLFIIEAVLPSGAITAVYHSDEGKIHKWASGTNLICSLTVAMDGAVNSVSFHNGGRVDLDVISRFVDETTGITNIANPPTLLDGRSVDIVEAWKKLSQQDNRFVVVEYE